MKTHSDRAMTRATTIGSVRVGGGSPFILIAGPCVIESEASALKAAGRLVEIAREAGVSIIYKSSYDKANRTSVDSFRGPGLARGLKILEKVKRKFSIPVLSDVHTEADVDKAAAVLDVIQIPAFLCRQTDLIMRVAKTGRVVSVKKGQFLAPWDMRHVVRKIESTGNRRILLTERGTSFGYNNLVSDFRSIPLMRSLGYPVIYDATHSVQMPGGKGDRSSGERRFVPHLSMAAIACGVDGIFLEVHDNPDRAPSDGPNMIKMSELGQLLKKLRAIEEAVR